MYEEMALFVAIGGQYVLLFTIYTKIGRLMWETRICPYHNKLLSADELRESGDRGCSDELSNL